MDERDDPQDESNETNDADQHDEVSDETPFPEPISEDAQPEGQVVELNAVDEAPEEPEVELTPLEALQKQLDITNARLRTVSKGYTDQKDEMKAFRERLENQAKYRREQQAFILAKSFFEPVQNLKRSLAAGRENPEHMVDGLEMVLQQFITKLSDMGMEEIPGVGAVFNPKLHEALGQTPVFEADQDGKILAVITDGFSVNGKVLQAAQVLVGKYTEPAGEA